MVELPPYTIWPYDCVDAMYHLIDEGSVHCVVTSPPYFKLRNYDHPGQVGLEATPQEYIARIVEVARAVRRVLRDDGTFWLNLGDSYASRSTYNAAQTLATANGWKQPGRGPNSGGVPVGFKDKDLIGIPWRVAFALQDDGWYLRQDIIWHKRNPMPESVRDRFTKAHEYLFLLTKSPRYYFDQEAVKETAEYGWRGSKFHEGQTAEHQQHRMSKARGGSAEAFQRLRAPRSSVPQGGFGGKGPIPGTGQSSFRAITETRNRRDVWSLSSKPYKGAHFATFPPDLVEPCVLAGSPPSCCSRCGAPRVAKVERKAMVIARSERRAALGEHGQTCSSGQMLEPATSRVLGYFPSCSCDAPDAPATVLDPFGGSGTTAVVARRHGRQAILCELNPGYVEMARARIEGGK